MHRRVFEQTVNEYQSFIVANAARFFAERGRVVDTETLATAIADQLDDFARYVMVFGAGITIREDSSEFEPTIVAA